MNKITLFTKKRCYISEFVFLKQNYRYNYTRKCVILALNHQYDKSLMTKIHFNGNYGDDVGSTGFCRQALVMLADMQLNYKWYRLFIILALFERKMEIPAAEEMTR